MKKIIVAAVVVFTTGVITIATRDSGARTAKANKIVIAFEKNVTATAD